MRSLRLLFLLFVFLGSCTPAPQSLLTAFPAQTAIQPTALQSTAIPTATLAPTATFTPTATPTPGFPLSQEDRLPLLKPISAQNATELIPVAGVNSATLSKVLPDEGQNTLTFITSLGVHSLNLSTFQLEINRPLLAIVFGREVSLDGRLVAQILPGNPKVFDMKLSVIELATGKTLCTYDSLPHSNTNTLRFHSDGALTYVTNGGTPNTILRIEPEQCHVTFNQSLTSHVMTISDDGNLAALGIGDELMIYKTSGFSKKKLVEVPNLRGAHFLPDGKSILITAQSGSAIYDLDSGAKTHDFPGAMGTSYVRYQSSLDGEWVVISSADHNRALRVKDSALFALPGEYIGLSDNPLLNTSSVLVNGYLVTKDSIWDIEKQGRIANLSKYGEWMYNRQVIISADGTRAVVSPVSDPWYMDMLDLSNGKIVFTIANYHHPIALSNREEFIATAQGKTSFFNFTSDQPLQTLDLHYTGGVALANGSVIVWDDKGSIYQLDAVTRKLLNTVRLPFILPEAMPQQISSTWAAGSDYEFDDFLASFMTFRWSQWVISHNRQIGLREIGRGTLQFFRVTENNLTRQEVLAEDVIATSAPGDVFEMIFSPDDRIAAGVFERKIMIWDAATGKELRTIALPYPPGFIYDFDFTSDGSKLLVSHGESGRDVSAGIHTNAILRIFNTQTGQQMRTHELWQVFRKSGCNISLPFVVTNDNARVISISQNCRLAIYDLSTWELQQELGEPFLDANIDLALSPDNNLLAVAYENQLELWDLSSGTLLKRYANSALRIYPPYRDAELDYIYQAAFSPDGRLLGTRFGRDYHYNSIITLWGVP